jgi:WD40 repeat protein
MQPTYYVGALGPARTLGWANTPIARERSRVLMRVPNVLDAETCAALVRHATEIGLCPTDRDYPPSYRDNDRLERDEPVLAAALYERLREALPELLVDEDGAVHRLCGLNERFRFCRYSNGQRFRTHRDGAFARSEDERSRLTVQIIYLDDASRFTGGATRFYDSRRGALASSVRPETGLAIVFDHDLWHDGEPVTAGVKHVMRTDVMYRRVTTGVSSSARADAACLRGHVGYVWSVLTLGDGRLATSSRDRTIRIWRDDGRGFECERVLAGHDHSVAPLAEPLPGVLVTGSRDRTVRRWDLARGTSRVIASHQGAVLSLASLGDGRALSGGADGAIQAHALEEGGERCAARIQAPGGWLWALAPLGGDLFASASEDGRVRLWSLGAQACLDAAFPERGPAHALAPIDDDTFVAGYADGHAITYAVDRKRGTLAPIDVMQLHDGEIYALLALPGGLLASGGEDDRARIHRARDHERLADVPHGGFVRSLARLPGGRIASGAYDGLVRVWRL